jgi:hypothetical protein
MKVLPERKLFLFFITAIISLSFSASNVAYASTLLDVPFTTQAPLGEWGDPRQMDGCEETSIVMAMMWAQGITLIPEDIRLYITGMSDYQHYFLGYYQDSSADDTARLMTDFFGYPSSNIVVRHNIGLLDIKSALDSGQLVIAPINPRIISTKYFNRYTINHTVVVVGYDDTRNTMIIHDPLHSWGGNLHIAQDIFENSLANYESGQYHKVGGYREKSMITISKVN